MISTRSAFVLEGMSILANQSLLVNLWDVVVAVQTCIMHCKWWTGNWDQMLNEMELNKHFLSCIFMLYGFPYIIWKYRSGEHLSIPDLSINCALRKLKKIAFL